MATELGKLSLTLRSIAAVEASDSNPVRRVDQDDGYQTDLGW